MTNLPNQSLEEQLVEARARLAKIRLLPATDFTGFLGNRGMLHGIDEKDKAIARAKARVAELRVLARLDSMETTDKQEG